MLTRDRTELVLGRGEVYFDPFLTGTTIGEGERYIGNTPRFRVERKTQVIERFTSYGGKKVRQQGATISETHQINFTTDNIHMDNVAMWHGNIGENDVFVSGSPVTETLQIRLGRFYQLGRTVRFQGLQNLYYAFIKVDGVTINPAGNFEFELSTGRLQVFKDAVDLVNGQTVDVHFDYFQADAKASVSAPKSVVGALRYVAKNAYGKNINYFFPQVEITPVGQIDLKSDDFQQINFEAVATNLNPNTEQLYVEVTQTTKMTLFQQTLLEYGLSEYEMVLYGDLINVNSGTVGGTPIAVRDPSGSVYVDTSGNLVGIYF